MRSIKARLERLENIVKQKVQSLIVGNDDGFLDAIVGEDHVDQYRDRNGGYDALKALSDTAVQDWKDWMEDQEGVSA